MAADEALVQQMCLSPQGAILGPDALKSDKEPCTLGQAGPLATKRNKKPCKACRSSRFGALQGATRRTPKIVGPQRADFRTNGNLREKEIPWE